jgi:hypothetical protein
MSEGEQQLKFFNAYYIEFLKTINDISKSKKETDNKETAVKICKAIKREYRKMDQLSPSYLSELNKTGIWEKYNALENKEIFTEEFKEIEVYNEICIKDICVVVEEPYFAHHLIAILDIFHENVPDSVGEIVKLLNKPEEFSQKLEEITDEDVKTKLAFLMRIHTKHKSASFGDNLKDIESTTLGKLAKEIMGDLNIEEIQKSMNEQNGNIFESFKNPNSGLGKVLSSVSQKMLSKIGSGELNQESLLTDAIDLAGKLPNLMPEGMGSQLGNIGEMLAQLQKMSKSKTGENPMDMMQEMMNGMNLNKAQKGRANSHMKSSINKSKLSDRLKKKLNKRKENNIQTEVKEDE